MKRLQFAATIHAPVPAVWRPTIDPARHERWASAFADGRYFEGSCDEGAKIRLRSRPHGDGMDAEIGRNRRHEFIAIRHLGDIPDGVEVTTGESVRAWAPHIDEAWPPALALLKLLAEAGRLR